MKIESSAVSMVATHSFEQRVLAQSSRRVRPLGVKDDSDSDSLNFYQKFMKPQSQALKARETKGSSNENSIRSIKLQLLQQILDAICGRGRVKIGVEEPQVSMGTVWEQVDTKTVFFSETEATTFASTGIVKTADGRTIDFNVELSMSRSFTETYESFSSKQYIVTDPLVVNVGSDVCSVSDIKFFFDLDSDGEEEEISFAGPGSGFLALDLNNDGVINNGSELFGTSSGDGFADLAKYDSDHNGWIDENDEIFDKLRIWTKDENGKDQLIDLKAADVGAIFLSASSTEFALTNEYNAANAFIRSTGVFLRESGGVGTINQVDLVS